MRKFFVLLGAALALFVGFTVAVTARYNSNQPTVQPVPELAIRDGAAERLAGSLRIRTVSSEDPAAFDADAFGTLHQYLQTAFPRVHAQLRRETVGTHSLLYTWQGSDSSLNPILLIGHLDVVPVETGTPEKWQHDPFGGRIVDGFIWGHGWAAWRQNSPMYYCPPDRFSAAEGVPALVQYLRTHPERLDSEAHILTFAALSSAYPCEPVLQSR